ncbi:MAG TPA: TerC family protein [Stellaceae bacterium]|nr:TerC family protein [Stellaceae bacterium]
MDWLTDPHIWASLATLTALEIVLGIDNLVFIAILAGRLPARRRNRARQVGLALALLTRLALLAAIAWIIGLTRPLFDVLGHPVSWRDIVLVGGGVFLLYKGTSEIHHRLEGGAPARAQSRGRAGFAAIVVQIVLLDIVFSLDSVITAVGMANSLAVMMAAIVIAVAIMLAASGPLAEFVERYPTVKMLALSFLLLIGMTLIADGAGFPIPRGYIYAAIGFSAGVEALNQIAARRRRLRAGQGRTEPPGKERDESRDDGEELRRTSQICPAPWLSE